MIKSKVIDKIYDKIFRARNKKEEEIFWKEFYGRKLELYKKKGITDLDNWIETRYYHKLKELVKNALNIDTFSGLKVLELGSGSGFLSLLMAREGASVVLVDKSKEAICYLYILFKELKKKGNFRGNVKMINSDMFTLNLPRNSFDIVHNYGVIEHFSYDEALRIVKLMKKFSKKRDM